MGAGTLTLTSTNTYTGDTTISAGTLTIGGAGTLGAGLYAGAVSISPGAAMDYASSSNQELSGVVSGTDLIRVTGTGVLTLSGSNNTKSTTDNSDAGGTSTDNTSTDNTSTGKTSVGTTSTETASTVTSNSSELTNIAQLTTKQDSTVYFYTDSANIPTWTPVTTYSFQVSALPLITIQTTSSASGNLTTTDTTNAAEGILITTGAATESKSTETKVCYSKVLCVVTKNAKAI
jgi:autotransporter-associated beta strand protein